MANRRSDSKLVKAIREHLLPGWPDEDIKRMIKLIRDYDKGEYAPGGKHHKTGEAYWVTSTYNDPAEFLEAARGRVNSRSLKLKLELIDMPKDANFQEVASCHQSDEYPHSMVIRMTGKGNNVEIAERSHDIERGFHDYSPGTGYFKFKGEEITFYRFQDRVLKIRDLFVNWGDICEAREEVEGETEEEILEEAYHIRKRGMEE